MKNILTLNTAINSLKHTLIDLCPNTKVFPLEQMLIFSPTNAKITVWLSAAYGKYNCLCALETKKNRFSPIGFLVQFRSYQDDRVSYFLTPIDRSFQKASEFLGS